MQALIRHRLQTLSTAVVSNTVGRPAGVLVALVERAAGLHVVLTRRADHLRLHAGQISFPGGRMDRGDGDIVATALRESFEEIGLRRQWVEIVGLLPSYYTSTGFTILPVVGFVAQEAEFVPEPNEVAEIFEVPFSFVLDPCNHRREHRIYRGRERWFFAIRYRHYHIWGATAAILVNFSHLLRKEVPGYQGDPSH